MADTRALRVGRPLVLGGFVAGCAATGASSTAPGRAADPAAKLPADHLTQISAEVDMDLEELTAPMHLTAEMKAWLHETVGDYGSKIERLRKLLTAIEDPDQLGVEYDPSYTGTAEEAFASRKVNCLSYTHLFVGMARELDVEAYFLSVRELERYARDGDLILVSQHITAGYGAEHERRILEFFVGPEVDYRSAVPIPDLDALALYYSNRGAEHLLGEDNEGARGMLDIAVAIAPGLSDGWINLGVARRRLGDLDGAEQAYLRALQAQPASIPALSNLAGLKRRRGDRDAAAEIMALLGRRRVRNPFVYLALGDASLQHGQLDDARRFFRRALRLDRRNAEAHAAMGSWALAAGDRQRARDWLDRAVLRDADNPRVRRLAGWLATGSPSDAAGAGRPGSRRLLQFFGVASNTLMDRVGTRAISTSL